MPDLSYLKPPEEDTLNNLALVANTASAATALWSDNATEKALVTFICSEDFYITMSKDHSGTVTSPVIASVTTGSRTWGPFLRGTPVSFEVGKRNRYFKAISESAAYLRWRIED